ncbi:hypothetical protein PUS82_00390 [Cytobacillus firmus]|uniref:hypothetical protein n=1 Tax=Cytobacillus firmus TaxID=1399 RepID=UPI00237A7547|nr:hypothetical protein [Cytobacillus firmus]MDD9309789.1 hypothetical protein [Cytobacillus firmus]
MLREKTSISFESGVLKELRKEAKERGVNVYDVVNDASKFYLQMKNSNQVDRVYAPLIEQFLEKSFKSFENRLASLMAKNALDSATTMFMMIQHAALNDKQDPEEMYQRSRKMGVKHVSNRDDLFKLLESKFKEEK